MLKFQKIILPVTAAGLGLATGGSGILWLQNNNRNRTYQRFFPPMSPVVFAADLDADKAEVSSSSGSSNISEDKLAALYAEPKPSPSRQSDNKDEFRAISKTRADLEEVFARCRRQITPIKDTVMKYTNNTIDFSVKTVDVAFEKVHYIKHEAPKEIKIATIVGSGLVGLLLSYRRGFFRKLIYSSSAAGVASLVIYPTQTKTFMTCSAMFIKKYTLVAYHFVLGDQPKPKEK